MEGENDARVLGLHHLLGSSPYRVRIPGIPLGRTKESNMRASLKPQVRGSQVFSTGTHRNERVNIVPEIDSENWVREQVATGGSFASDRPSKDEREFESFRRMMQGNRGVL